MNLQKVYKKIARQSRVSVNEVMHEIQSAITEAWGNCPNDGITKAYQNQVPCRSTIPTPDELILFMAGHIKIEEHKRDMEHCS